MKSWKIIERAECLSNLHRAPSLIPSSMWYPSHWHKKPRTFSGTTGEATHEKEIKVQSPIGKLVPDT